MLERLMSQSPSSSRSSWTQEAACLNRDPSLWTLSEIQSDRQLNKDHFEEAEVICSTCPVFNECWSHATDLDKRVTMRAGAWPIEYKAPSKRRTPKGRESKGTCVHGHDTSLVTQRTDRGECRECRSIRDKRRRKLEKEAVTL